MSEARRRRAIQPDYDQEPGRFRTARSVLRRHALASDVHERVAGRLVDEQLTPVLDVGCGEGELARHLPEGAWVGLDDSRTMLAAAPQPAVLGEATELPFPDASFDAVALLYVLYHLSEPARALEEAHRVLRAGGLVAVAAPSRHDSPELAHLLPSGPLTFDAELAPELLSERFGGIEVEPWDAQLLELPTEQAVSEYLVGKGVPAERGPGRSGVGEGAPASDEARGARLRQEGMISSRGPRVAGHVYGGAYGKRISPPRSASRSSRTRERRRSRSSEWRNDPVPDPRTTARGRWGAHDGPALSTVNQARAGVYARSPLATRRFARHALVEPRGSGYYLPRSSTRRRDQMGMLNRAISEGRRVASSRGGSSRGGTSRSGSTRGTMGRRGTSRRSSTGSGLGGSLRKYLPK